MVDNPDSGPRTDNLRFLIYYFGGIVDDMLYDMRKGGPYEKVRNSDIRVFMVAARTPRTISEVARFLRISRQSVQSSLQRLIKLGVVSIAPVPGNKRDKLVVITQRGMMAHSAAGRQIEAVERQFAAELGKEQYESLREGMKRLVAAHDERFTTTPRA